MSWKVRSVAVRPLRNIWRNKPRDQDGKNMFAFASLKFGGEMGSQFPLTQRSKAMFVLVRPGRAGFSLRPSAGFKGRVTWVSFQDLCFQFDELFQTLP